MIGPYRSNEAFETISTAVSLEVLERLATEWQSKAPYPSWTTYGAAFQSYRERCEREALSRLELSELWQQKRLGVIKARLQKENAALDAKGDLSSDHARDVQMVGGMILRSEFSPGEMLSIWRLVQAPRRR